MKIIKYCLATLAAASIISCSSLDVDIPEYDDLLKAETEQDGRACIRQNNIRGYGVLDDDVISISATGKKRHYLVTTMYRCYSLQSSFAAGFKGSFSELCGGGGDKIVTNEESCPIDSIFEFDSRDEAFAAFEKVEKIRDDILQEAKQKASENPKD